MSKWVWEFCFGGSNLVCFLGMTHTEDGGFLPSERESKDAARHFLEFLFGLLSAKLE